MRSRMDYVKKAIWGPDPKEQMRKINQLLRKNKRELDRSINQLQPLRKKTEGLVKQSVKNRDLKSAKIYAKELINIKKQYNKLYMSKTRIESITMSINEQWSMNKLTNSLLVLTGVMKDVNKLINLGVVLGTMQELQKELMKAGVINEMMDDMVDLDAEDEFLEGDSQEEVNKIIESLTQEKLGEVSHETPTEPVETEAEIEDSNPEKVQEETQEDFEALKEMRERLKALEE